MASSKVKLSIVSSFTLILFIINCAFSYLAGNGTAPDLFPNKMADVSDAYKLLITPVGATFSIWGVIYFLQFAWLLYVLSCVFRNGPATEILSMKFFMCFNISTALVIGWLFSWTRKEVVPSFIIIALNQVFLDLTFGLASSDLHDYEASHEIAKDNQADVWCHRVLIQNGILFYGTWTTIATLINAAIVLNQELGATDQTSSIIALVLLTLFAIAWFYTESFALQKYTDYTCSAYVTLIYALSGIFAGVWGKNDVIGGLTLALLIVSILLLIIRIVLIVLRSQKRASYETISYNANTNTVRT